MTDGVTCYERDEELCEDQMCQRTGCRLRNERLSGDVAQPVGMRDALESIAARKVVIHGDRLVCQVCGYKSVSPHTEERHAPNCARQVARDALAKPAPAATVETNPWSMEEALSDDGAAKVNAVLAGHTPSSAATDDDVLLRALDRIRAGLSNDESADFRGADPIADLKVLLADYDRLRAVPQAPPETRKHSETYRLGMDAAFNEVADYMQEQKLYAYAEHIRRRASVALSRPQSK